MLGLGLLHGAELFNGRAGIAGVELFQAGGSGRGNVEAGVRGAYGEQQAGQQGKEQFRA